ncbi:MAG: hypothetical protein JSW11_10400 [Candidatus Heimdallarchaeota archaeon]|nr:MAG: hypothetical protein JSW11_10400 [Candidatus Heimdallarchaeota archaeon]
MEPKTRKIQEILEKITNAKEKNNWDEINSQLLKKRLQWLEENKKMLEPQGTDVRRAYTLFLIQYLDLDPAKVPIIFEDETKIIWRSFNWCPVLEACTKGGFDTREVCKKGWEQSVQAFMEKMNPKLRFIRNYDKIRPYTSYCEEMIELLE